MAAEYIDKRTLITTVLGQYLSFATFPIPLLSHNPLPLNSFFCACFRKLCKYCRILSTDCYVINDGFRRIFQIRILTRTGPKSSGAPVLPDPDPQDCLEAVAVGQLAAHEPVRLAQLPVVVLLVQHSGTKSTLPVCPLLLSFD
jgi:hypothetical protein